MEGLIRESFLGAIERVLVNYGLPCAFRYCPKCSGIDNPLRAKTMGALSKNAATTVLGIFEQAVDCTGVPCCPRDTAITNAVGSQFGSDCGGPFLVLREHSKDVAHATHFMVRAGHQNNPVRLERFSFRSRKNALGIAIGRDKHPAKSVAGFAACPESTLGNPLASLIDLCRQLPAEFAGHDPLQCFQNRAGDRIIVSKLLRTVVDLYSCRFAQKFVMGCFIRILEPPPPAHVID